MKLVVGQDRSRLAAGDRFKLFDAASYQNAFFQTTLPFLSGGLTWSNKLAVDGSIEVVGIPPTVQTQPADGVQPTTARMNGRVNPNGTPSAAWFEWGTTTNYGNVTTPQPLGSGTSFTNFSEVLVELTSNVVHHFRAVASNSFGVVLGADQSFRTRTPSSGLITYLKASNTDAPGTVDSLADQFGFSVAISGGTVVIGAVNEDSNATGVNGDQGNTNASGSGAAYVFVRNGTDWSQQAYFKASNTGAGDQFGSAVAISGDTIVVAARSEDSSDRGVNGDQNNNDAANSGAAYVFVRNGTNWTQQAYLKASNTGAGDFFGNGLAISRDTIVIGARFESSNATGVNGNQTDNSSTNSGAAYVFMRNGTNWTQQAYLKASNTSAGDEFGRLVAISGDIIVVGAAGEDSNATGINGNQNDESSTNAGAAYVFVRSGTNWSQQAYLKAGNAEAGDQFGIRVAASGDTIVIGASDEDSNATGVNGDGNNNSATNSGAAYVFVRTGTNWSQQAYLKASNTGASDQFGIWVALDAGTAVIGATAEDSTANDINGDDNDNTATESGAAYVFVRSGTNWSQQFYLKASNTDPGDRFGFAAAASGGTVVVGADLEESPARGINGDEGDNSAPGAGAAYVFNFNPPVLNIVQSGVDQVAISWMPPTPGFVLQESLDLSPNGWSNAPSGQTNPITLPASDSTKFFRLSKP